MAIEQAGPVVPFHPGVFFGNGVVGDGGTPEAPFVSALGIFGGPDTPFGISSQTGPGVSTEPGSLFSVQATASAITLAFTGTNGGPNPDVFFNIDGVDYELPLQAGAGNAGIGNMQLVPAGTTNGQALATPPAGYSGVRFYLPVGASITFTIQAAQPVSAPPVTFTVSQASTGPNWDENLNGQYIFITATTGAPIYRYY